MKLPGVEYETQGATFDPSRRYRYTLWRVWGPPNGTTLLWIMLNPSTADEDVLDPTLRRCENFSRAAGFDGFEVCNLFAFRATDQKAMLRHESPVGPDNDAAIKAAAARADRIMVGWGSEISPRVSARANYILGLLQRDDRTLFCLGVNADESPKHPLYLPRTTKISVYLRRAL